MDSIIEVPARRVLIDFFIFTLVSCTFGIYLAWGKPFKRGFFCNDESISYPYKKASSLEKCFIFGGNGIVPILIVIINYIKERRNKSRFSVLGLKLTAWAWNAYRIVGIFLFGGFCTQFTCSIIKNTLGVLRPYFMDVCKPNIDCTDSLNANIYHEDFKCLNDSEVTVAVLQKARLSFPSGHCVFSAYTMVFFIIYLQRRISWSGSGLLKHFLQFMAGASIIVVGTSRISSYNHHGIDVVAGSCLGAFGAFLTLQYVCCKTFKSTNNVKNRT